MSQLIPVALIIFMSGCAYIKRDVHQAQAPSVSHKVFCSDTNGDRLHLRLTITLKVNDIKERTLHKQFEVPYFKGKEGGPPYFRVSREILEWRNDRIILAEVMPTETPDIFMLHVTAFEKSKRVEQKSSSDLLLRLCQDAEMSISNNKKFHTLKARLELILQGVQ